MNSDRLAWKIFLPVIIGVAVVIALFAREFNPQAWAAFRLDGHSAVALVLAAACVAGREIGYSWRFRVLTDGQLRWWQALRVTLLTEFTSCVTPSTVGGSSLGMLFLHREGIGLGRATTLMVTTLFLDEAFFVVALPVALLILPSGMLFACHDTFSYGLRTALWIVYGITAAWTAILFVGIFIKPRAIGRALMAVFSIRLLSRWRPAVEKLTDDMELTGRTLRSKPLRWWWRASAATVMSWLSRFFTVNALFWAFAPLASQLIVLGRQIVVWLVLMVSPTPGGSGLSEWIFTQYYGDLIGSDSVALVIALMWRLLTYYIYLIVGAFIVPSWLARMKK